MPTHAPAWAVCWFERRCQEIVFALTKTSTASATERGWSCAVWVFEFNERMLWVLCRFFIHFPQKQRHWLCWIHRHRSPWLCEKRRFQTKHSRSSGFEATLPQKICMLIMQHALKPHASINHDRHRNKLHFKRIHLFQLKLLKDVLPQSHSLPMLRRPLSMVAIVSGANAQEREHERRRAARIEQLECSSTDKKQFYIKTYLQEHFSRLLS